MAMQALVMGFGGTGAHILTALKELTVLKHGSMPESIKFLLFDTIADWEPGKNVSILGGAAQETVAKGSEKATSLDKFTEYFYLSDHDPDLKKHVYTYLTRAGTPDNYPHLKDWLHAPWLSKHVQESRLDIVGGAAQQRQIGRFAMFQNAERIIERLGGLIRSLAQHSGDASVNIWIIASSAGGTGAGCFLDAAYMTRLAAGNTNYTLTGVIVLPEVYNGVPGISHARAYSLLRELDRVQEQGIPESDRYQDLRSEALISSEVRYDARERQVARVKAKLFDDLFYLGQACSIENQRKSFFTAVANAIDPYLDANSGPRLLEMSVNRDAAASSFGAARLYVPMETFTDIFAWEQVQEYLRGASAPVEQADRVTNVYSGSPNERQKTARSKVENLLALFGEILQRVDWPDNQKENWARSQSLDAETIITGWYQFAGAAIADERLTPADAQVIQTTYLNPFVSLIHTGKVPPQELETRTYRENREVKGVKESQEESRDRFANRLEAIITQYTSPGGGERSLEKGRKLVFEKVSNRLRNRVDNLIINELQQNPVFAVNPGAPEDGTSLTRLFEELRQINSDDGPLKKIDATISKFLDTLLAEEGKRQQQPVNALHDLRTSKKTGFNPLGVWVESYQVMAREECVEYIRWYQKRALLKDMQRIVRSVADRFVSWERTINTVLDSLVIREGVSALFNVRKVYLSQLEDRLLRATTNASALMGISNDPEMDGYRAKLRQRCIYKEENETLAASALSNSRWEASVTTGFPELHLLFDQETTVSYNGDTIKNLPGDLYHYFHREIDRVLRTTNIFDYLLYMRGEHDLEPGNIAELLNTAAKPLINADRAPEEAKLIYKEPSGKDKMDLAALIQKELKERNTSAKDPEKTHSDQNSISMVKIKKPSSVNEIMDLDACRRDYFKWLAADKNQMKGDVQDENDLYRAQVYHPFRPELEAWFIERAYWSASQQQPNDLMQPRIVRLLEYPEMMHAFVQCLATEAVEKVGNDWIWHSPHKDVKLTDFTLDPEVDVIRAAIVFVLQQREVGTSTQKILLREAQQSAVDAAQKKTKDFNNMLNDFRSKSRLNEFLKKHLPNGNQTGEEQHLRMVLEFYSDPATQTRLQHRMKL